jgi:hypothetical protein
VVTSIDRSRVEASGALFAIKVDFDKERTDPSKMFLALSKLTEALESTDKTLLKSFNLSIEPVTLVENIEEGSILIWLRNALESIDDDAIKSLEVKKVIGTYLVKAKRVIISFIDKRTEIKGIEEIDYLKAELIDAARDTRVNALDIYNSVNTIDLLQNINSINESVRLFDEFTQVNYCLPESQSVPFNKFFNISPESIEDIATKEIRSGQNRMILKVKKPDYLGESKWEFRHGTKKIEAKITDSEWLEKFRNREIDLRPGDSLEAEVLYETRYDHNDEVISETYSINQIIAVRPMVKTLQYELDLLSDKDKQEKDKNSS